MQISDLRTAPDREIPWQVVCERVKRFAHYNYM
jgi:hypothetical protein